MPDMTLSQLAQYNGKNGKPSYVAVKNKIYNVSGTFPNGRHMSQHDAGKDLTTAYNNKHGSGSSKITGYPFIGNLINETQCTSINCNFKIEQ